MTIVLQFTVERLDNNLNSVELTRDELVVIESIMFDTASQLEDIKFYTRCQMSIGEQLWSSEDRSFPDETKSY